MLKRDKVETWNRVKPGINKLTFNVSAFLPIKVWPTVMNSSENSIPFFDLSAVIEKSAMSKSAEPFRIWSKNINGELFFLTSEAYTKINNNSCNFLQSHRVIKWDFNDLNQKSQTFKKSRNQENLVRTHKSNKFLF